MSLHQRVSPFIPLLGRFPITLWFLILSIIELLTISSDSVFAGILVTFHFPLDYDPLGCCLFHPMGLMHLTQCPAPSEVALSCLTLGDSMDCSLPGSFVHGIFQARILEWGAIAFSMTNLDNVLKSRNISLPKKSV